MQVSFQSFFCLFVCFLKLIFNGFLREKIMERCSRVLTSYQVLLCGLYTWRSVWLDIKPAAHTFLFLSNWLYFVKKHCCQRDRGQPHFLPCKWSIFCLDVSSFLSSLAALYSLWDLSSPTKDWTRALGDIHWTIKEFPTILFSFLLLLLF